MWANFPPTLRTYVLVGVKEKLSFPWPGGRQYVVPRNQQLVGLWTWEFFFFFLKLVEH
jgi:hypothetical protein